jgi:hypothetical protein
MMRDLSEALFCFLFHRRHWQIKHYHGRRWKLCHRCLLTWNYY